MQKEAGSIILELKGVLGQLFNFVSLFSKRSFPSPSLSIPSNDSSEAIWLDYLQIDCGSEALAGVHSLGPQLLFDSQDLFD
jgi:hypothetical protein